MNKGKEDFSRLEASDGLDLSGCVPHVAVYAVVSWTLSPKNCPPKSAVRVRLSLVLDQ